MGSALRVTAVLQELKKAQTSKRQAAKLEAGGHRLCFVISVQGN